MKTNRLSVTETRFKNASVDIIQAKCYTYEGTKSLYDVIVYDNGSIAYRKDMKFVYPEKKHKDLLIHYHILNHTL